MASLEEIVITNSLDIFVITETWLKQGKEHTFCMLRDLLPGYKLTSLPRTTRGGSLAVLSRNEFTKKVNLGLPNESFEYLNVMLSAGNITFRVISIYRPPPSVKNKLTFSQFILDFSDLMERIMISPNKIILAGDFNIHFSYNLMRNVVFLWIFLIPLIYINTLLVLPIALVTL